VRDVIAEELRERELEEVEVLVLDDLGHTVEQVRHHGPEPVHADAVLRVEEHVVLEIDHAVERRLGVEVRAHHARPPTMPRLPRRNCVKSWARHNSSYASYVDASVELLRSTFSCAPASRGRLLHRFEPRLELLGGVVPEDVASRSARSGRRAVASGATSSRA